jgi:lauroyl/myristoyl acyltransferase
VTLQPAAQRGSVERLQRYLRGRLRRLSFLSLLALSRLCNRLPLRATVRLGEWLGYLHYLGCPLINRRIAGDLAVLFGIEHATARRLLRSAYIVNGRAALEIIAFGDARCPAERWSSLCNIAGLAALQGLAERGQAAILLGLHMGNGILMAGQLAAAGLPVSVVYRESRKLPAGYLHNVLARLGLEPIAVSHRDAHAGTRKMLRALRGGRQVFVLMDQASKYDDGIELTFLSKRAVMPDGVARLALATSVPVIPILLQQVDPVWRFTVADPVPAAADSDALVRAMADLMERHIRTYPHYWTWHHRRWRHEPLLGPHGEQPA